MSSSRSTHSVQPASPLSPLSPGYKASHMEHLQQLPSWSKPSRSSNKPRRPPTNSLKLPPLPRFHPANFPSQHSSQQPTPDGHSPCQPPMSPRSHQRMYSDIQRQLYLNQREIFHESISAASSTTRPDGPKLVPLGSPGPVTPLELEGEGGGYLLAGARSERRDKSSPREVVDEFISQETRRRRESARR